MKSCVVCNEPFRKGDKTSLHIVPRDSRRSRWLKALNLSEDAARYTWVCSNHFNLTDFVAQTGGRKILKKDAVPNESARLSLYVLQRTDYCSSSTLTGSEHGATSLRCSTPITADELVLKNSSASITMASKHEMKNSPSSNPTAFECTIKYPICCTPTAFEQPIKNSPPCTPTAFELTIKNSPPCTPTDFEHTIKKSPPCTPTDFEHTIKNSPPCTPTDFEHTMKKSPPCTPTDFEHAMKNSPPCTLTDFEYTIKNSPSSCSTLTASECGMNSPPSCPTASECGMNSPPSSPTASEHGTNEPYFPLIACETSDLSNGYSPEEKKTVKKRFNTNPRYLGDVCPRDMDNPVTSRRILKISKETILRQKGQITALQRINRRLKQKVEKLNELTEHLQQHICKCQQSQ